MKLKHNIYTNVRMWLFWGTHDVFSNWYPSQFIWQNITFNCGEQYMMYRKAMLFGDTAAMEAIMATKEPRIQKQLGRSVKNFDSELWSKECVEIMVDGLLQKFSQNSDMKKVLLDTKLDEIVEASPFDTIWGVGMDENDPNILYKDKWLGKNLLGVVLMRVRDLLGPLPDQINPEKYSGFAR